MSRTKKKEEKARGTDRTIDLHHHIPFISPRINLSPKTALVVLLGLLSLAAATQVPDEVWHELLHNRYVQPNLLGFVFLSAIYTLAIVFMAPLSPFALAAGILFGFWWGTFLALLALNIGATLAFLIARFLFRRQISRELAANSKMAVIAKAMRGDAVRTIAILRLNPIVPFNLQNYVCGATGVKFSRYALGTFLGAAPFTVALVYLGHTGRQLVIATGMRVEEWTVLLFVVGLLVTMPMTVAMLRTMVKRIRESRENDKTATQEE